MFEQEHRTDRSSVKEAIAPGPLRAVPGVASWRRLLWIVLGFASLLLGGIGIFLPLLPTVPFVLLAAACFSRGSARWERWLLTHPRFGPWVQDWRISRAVPLRAKQWAWATMGVSSALAWWAMPRYHWLPALCCAAVGVWLWRLPTKGDQPPP
jgi:uncharacterized protein